MNKEPNPGSDRSLSRASSGVKRSSAEANLSNHEQIITGARTNRSPTPSHIHGSPESGETTSTASPSPNAQCSMTGPDLQDESPKGDFQVSLSPELFEDKLVLANDPKAMEVDSTVPDFADPREESFTSMPPNLGDLEEQSAIGSVEAAPMVTDENSIEEPNITHLDTQVDSSAQEAVEVPCENSTPNPQPEVVLERLREHREYMLGQLMECQTMIQQMETAKAVKNK